MVRANLARGESQAGADQDGSQTGELQSRRSCISRVISCVLVFPNIYEHEEVEASGKGAVGT